jgi:hypothetical protein
MLGIVHTPRSVLQLFCADNVTPATDSPTSPATGYADLAEEQPTPLAEIEAELQPPDPV